MELFENHFPSAFRLNIYLANKVYEWIIETSTSRGYLLTCCTYLVAIPYHFGMLLLTPITVAWDLIMIVGYLLNSICNCYRFQKKATTPLQPIGRLESINHAFRHTISLSGGTLAYSGINLLGLFAPQLAFHLT